jgi:pimeloyl-ACP methyl ester carboxylesterase
MAETVALHADDGGGGEATPVVLLHSLAGNSGQWAAQLAHLRRGRRAVALDWRGHGHSGPAADGDWRPEALAEDVEAAVTRLGLERFVLVGHSAGGAVALAYAAAHPARVAGLLLLDAAGDSRRLPREMMEPFLAALDSPAYAGTIEGYWASISGSDPALRERLLADLRATPRQAVAGVFRSLMAFDPGPALRAYRGPRLSVVTPRNTGPLSLRALDPELPQVVVNDSGHWIQLQRPEEFNRILDDFLGQAEGGGTADGG